MDMLGEGTEEGCSAGEVKQNLILPVFATVVSSSWGEVVQHRCTLPGSPVFSPFHFCLSCHTHSSLPAGLRVFPSLAPEVPSCLWGVLVCAVVLSCLNTMPQLVLFQRQEWGPTAMGIYFNPGFLPGFCHL